MPSCAIDICENYARNGLCASCRDAGVTVWVGDVEMEWRDLPTHPGYQVSKCGQIRSIQREIVSKSGKVRLRLPSLLKQWRNSGGYWLVELGRGKKRLVHRLVASVWCPPYTGENVDHRDSDIDNNHADNLRWCTFAENIDFRTQRTRQQRSAPAAEAP